MKHRFSLLLLVFAVLLASAPMARADVLSPDPSGNPSPSPDIKAPPAVPTLCDVPTINDLTDECFLAMLDPTPDGSSLIGWLTQLAATTPFVGEGGISLALILRYMVMGQNAAAPAGEVVYIKIGATCQALVAGEKLPQEMYYICIQTLVHASANFKQVMCPAIERLLVSYRGLILSGNAGAATKKAYETALAAQAAWCSG